MKAGLRSLVLLAWLGPLTACAGDRLEPTGEAAPLREPARVRIDNRSWSDVRIYLARGRARSVLGFVTAGGTDTFPVPADFLAGSSELMLIADPVGSVRSFLSEPFLIHDGRVVEWTIMNEPAQSILIVQ